MTAPLLEVSDLDAWYGQAQALHKVHLTVAPGECVALIGRNGAGKTTTLRSIMGVLRKKTGTIRFRGQDILKLDSHEIARRGIAYVPEERAIFATLSVSPNGAYAPSSAVVQAAEAIRPYVQGYAMNNVRPSDPRMLDFLTGLSQG